MLITPPGQNGLAGEIAELRRQVAELSRRNDSWVPTLTLKLSAPAQVASATDVFAQGGWNASSGNSTITWTVPPSGAAYATLPIAGRYSIHFHCSFQQSSSGICACKILKNGTIVIPGNGQVTNVIGSDTRNALAGIEGTVLDAIVDQELFNAGDALYFSVSQSSGSTINLNSQNVSGPTSITIRYVGST